MSLPGRHVAFSVFLFASCAFGQRQPIDVVSYVWTYQGTVHGTMLVPPGYKEQTENYKEGIITHPSYPDGSYIVLQHGGMYAIPIIRDTEHVVSKADDGTKRLVRRGSVRGTTLFWREDNFKRDPQKRNQVHPLFYMFPPN